MKDWRLANGPGKEVFFTQDHTPGKVLAMDWTDMGSAGIKLYISMELNKEKACSIFLRV